MKKENVPGILLFDDARYSQRKAQEQCAALVDILLKNIGGYVAACDKVCSRDQSLSGGNADGQCNDERAGREVRAQQEIP